MRNKPIKKNKPVSKLVSQASQLHHATSTFSQNKFYEQAHNPKKELKKEQYEKGLKRVALEELKADNLDFFIKNGPEMKKSFKEELLTHENNPFNPQKIELFETAVNSWVGGSKTQKGCSVYKNLLTVLESKRTQAPAPSSSIFSVKDVDTILEVTWRELEYWIQKWLDSREELGEDPLSMGSVYLKRGLFLDSLPRINTLYTPTQDIASFSLSTSVAESFAQIPAKAKGCVCYAELGLFKDIALFFTPFILKDAFQIEFGCLNFKENMVFKRTASKKTDDLYEVLLEPK